MFKPFSLFLGLRYTRARRRNGFVSFISMTSVIGIALGVMVLIAVLSVMNGYNRVVSQKFFSIAPQLTVVSYEPLREPQIKIKRVFKGIHDIVAYAPYVSGKGMLVTSLGSHGVAAMGIDPLQEMKLSALSKFVTQGSMQALRAGQYHLAIGEKLAAQLGLQVGDKVTMLTPHFTVSPLGTMPRFRQFIVGAIFATHSGFGYDSGMVYMHIKDAQHLFVGAQAGEQGFHVKVADVYRAPQIAMQVRDLLGPAFAVSDWGQQFGSLFKAIAMQKTIMSVILTFIITVAAFNLVSSLVMAVQEKRSDIAILRTLGASTGCVMRVFIAQGCIVGLFGVVLGGILGCIMSLHLTAWVNALQHFLGVQLVSADVYWVDYLPTELRWLDVLHVGLMAFGLSLLATLYPARLASRVSPAEVLRYE